MIEESGRRVRPVKEEALDDLDCDWVRSAEAKRALVAVLPPGSSHAKRKRKRASSGRAKPDKRADGGVHALDRNSSASGAGHPTAWMSDDARSSRGVKSRESSRGVAGDRPGSAKKALVSSEESRGAPGKARSGGGARRERSTSVAPANWIGTSIGSRIRSRSRKQGTGQYSARVSSEDTGEDEVQEQKQKRVEDVESMDVDDDDDNNTNEAGNGIQKESEQDEALEGRSRQDSHALIDNEEEVGEKELSEEEEDDNQEESHSMYDGEGEQEEDASEEVEQEMDETGEEDEKELDGTGEEDEQELDGAGKAQPVTPSNTIAGSSMRSGGDDTRVFRRRVFEGICLPQKPRKTVGKGIGARTRSQRKCKDKKLLRRGTFSKPYNIDIPDSTSDSEEDIEPPAPQQGLLSSSEEGNITFGKRKHRRAIKNRRRKRPSTSSDEEYRVYARDGKDRPFRRLKKGLSKLQAGKEGCGRYVGSNPGHAKYNGPNGENQSNEQDGIFFKRTAHKIRMKKHGPVAKAAYDELLNSLFSGWEDHINDPDHAAAGNSLPLVFSFGDEDAEENIENDKYQEDLWRECDIAFESMDIGNGSEEDGLEIPPVEVTSCNNGQHEFIIDEQIGVRCKHCNVVDIEIRHVLPTLGKFSAERESAIDPELDKMLKEMLSVFEQNDVLVSNGHELPCNFGGHKAGSVWDLIPGVKETMFPHQQDAFEFLWTKLAGGTTIEQLKQTVKSDVGGGCVISHAPGTGKTRLAITFVQSYLEVFPRCRPVIIAPRGMLATWEKEFRKWKVKLPFHVLNSTEINWSEDKTIQEQVAKNGTFHRRLLTDKMDQNYRRLVKLGSWMNGTSIIGLSYSLFRKLANHEGMDGDKVRKLLLEKPGLLVLDEGHTPRNKKSLIWKVLERVSTEKRIILSGTLFQNNFEELKNTLRLVRTKEADGPKEADAVHLETDEGKDFWSSLRLNDITEADINEVRKKLDPIVHIHSGKFLQKSLPGLGESVVILNPLPYQKEVIATMEKTVATTGLDEEYKISIASIHPSLLASAKLSEQEESILDIPKLESLRSRPSEGVKTRFVLEIVRLCEALNERVLVFSQYLGPLSLIMEQLKAKFNWAEGKEILLMSGKVPVKNRQTMMEVFNDMKSKAKVMLASTKACCEGITLIGASRVVLLDVVWNPSVGRQAIGRAYRIGQEKIVYTYNLIAQGTREKSKYDTQAKKEHMSKLLFSKEPEHGECNLPPELTFNDRVLEEMTAREDLKELFVKIYVDNQTDGSRGEMEKNNTCPQD
ncbi:SNF2 domain-containing protein CLASSY 3 [Sorghum bicolor]|uniref:Uncharacterized protein n=1 Tax=Sorghum bicolor TaxID=4558 RepID=A0A194YSE6_SORBI|nr:SNF2 domain-containing protein CLASSY 3 [Sorghum bicolor]KXG31163.2 hypothetical protein SORBI_3004G299200 [Sorghum bicolor]|eukprot:XP_021314635.1 SNF2 domain-containing protein CLASSY 3 [Sorghum bicolor]